MSEDQLQAFLPVLSNDPSGARLWSISAGPPHALGGSQSTSPRTITILDNGITYTGFASISNGRINLDFSQSSALIGALGNGDVLTGSFYYQDRLANGRFSSAKVTFTIRGTADAANITGTASGSVFEDGTLTAGGTLNANDADAGENLFQTPGSLTGAYGTFTFNAATGVWGYTLSNGAAFVQALKEGDTEFDQLTVTSFDGSDSETITVTINGADDGASITATTPFSDLGSVGEDHLVQTASGSLTITDPDTNQAAFQTPASLTGTYGDFTFNDETGAWGYTLRNDDANVQALDDLEGVYDTLEVTSLDGSATHTITISIEGQEDVAAIAGTITGNVYEDGTATASGTLVANDPDAGENKFQGGGTTSMAYGDFDFNAETGEWTFTIDNAAAQALTSGGTFGQSIIFTSLDGSDSQQVSVTVHGEDDASVLGGDTQGVVHDDGVGGLETAGGTVTVDDPDAGLFTDGFDPLAVIDLAGDYGTFTFNAATGAWTYDLDSNNVDVNALGDEGQLFDYLHPVGLDGTVLEIMVTIFGHA